MKQFCFQQLCRITVKYNRIYAESRNDSSLSDDEMQFCGILGEKLPAARIHDKIKFSGGNSVGSVLVGMK